MTMADFKLVLVAVLAIIVTTEACKSKRESSSDTDKSIKAIFQEVGSAIKQSEGALNNVFSGAGNIVKKVLGIVRSEVSTGFGCLNKGMDGGPNCVLSTITRVVHSGEEVAKDVLNLIKSTIQQFYPIVLNTLQRIVNIVLRKD